MIDQEQLSRNQDPDEYTVHKQEAEEGILELGRKIQDGSISGSDVHVRGWHGRLRAESGRVGVYWPPAGKHSVDVSNDSRSGTVGVESKAGIATPSGTSAYNGSVKDTFRDMTAPSDTVVRRYDGDNNLVYEHTFKSPKAPRLITRLALKELNKDKTHEAKADGGDVKTSSN